MRSQLFTLAIACAIGATGGCGWSRQHVELRPTIPFARSDIAGGRTVDLRVADARPRGEVGRRVGPGAGGSISTNQDLRALMHDAIADALRRKGFAVAPSGRDASAILSIELRSFEYEVARVGISNNARAWALLEASCESAGHGYANFYRAHNDRDRRAFPLSPESNEVLLNETFSGVLRMPFADRQLLDCIAGSASATGRSDQTP